MNSILSVNYATLLRKFRDRRATTNLSRLGKSQTLSGQSRKVLFVAWPVLRKVRSASAHFEALLAGILSMPSIELLPSKIQTASAKSRRRCLRNLESIAMQAAVARGESLDILRAVHPPSLWLCQAQMWRVFLFAISSRDNGLRRSP